MPSKTGSSTIVPPSGTSSRRPVPPTRKPEKPKLTEAQKEANRKNIATIFEIMQTLDCVFCVDTTGSMDDYIVAVKETIAQLIKNVTKQTEVQSIKFGFVAYRDHQAKNEEYVKLVKPLTD